MRSGAILLQAPRVLLRPHGSVDAHEHRAVLPEPEQPFLAALPLLRAMFTAATCSYSARYCFISIIFVKVPEPSPSLLNPKPPRPSTNGGSYLKESVLAEPDVSFDARSGSERSTLERLERRTRKRRVVYP